MSDLDLSRIAQQCEGCHQDKAGWRAKCPLHQGQSDTSLHLWEENGEIRLHCFAGCQARDILAWLNVETPKRSQDPTYDAIYSYHDERGVLQYQVVRLPGKKFRQRRPDPKQPGRWVWNMEGAPPLLYRLPEVAQAIVLRQPIYLVEGEKDVETLRALGFVATCNRGGALKWDDAYTAQLTGADVVLLPDNDEPGRKHATMVLSRLRGAVRNLVRIDLPGLPDHGDVSDWLAQGHTREEVEALYKATPPALSSPHLVVSRFADIPPEDIEWLWRPYLAKGKITILEGDPGQGKTYFMLALAASLTQGFTLPDQRGRPGPPGESPPQNILYVSAEDGLADTLVPRAIKAGADLTRLYGVRGVEVDGDLQPFTLAQISMLSEAVHDLQAQLVIIDPIQAFLGADVDMHRANEVRPLMAALARLAEVHKCSVLIIRHINKSLGGKALYRGMGSIDFTAAARSVLVVAESLEDPSKKIIAQAKNSYAPLGASLIFSITEDGFAWCGVAKISADELVGQQPAKHQHQRVAAAEWLVECLKDGELPANTIRQEAEANGIAWRTIERAKQEMRVISFKKLDLWYWKLPPLQEEEENTPF